MSSNKDRFEQLMFPVFSLKDDQDPILSFPGLRHKEFRAFHMPDRVGVIRYIMVLYDQESPLMHEYHDLGRRKEAALKIAGYSKTKTGNYFKIAKQLMDLDEPKVRKMVLKFFDIQDNMSLDMIHTFEQMFYEYRELMMRPVLTKAHRNSAALDPTTVKNIYSAADFKKKLREECMAIKQDLEQLYASVFGDNDDVKQIFMHQRKSTPENIADIELKAHV